MVSATASTDDPACLQWLHYAEGMIMPPVNTIIVETIQLPPEQCNEVNVDQAESILAGSQADLIAVARALLYNPN